MSGVSNTLRTQLPMAAALRGAVPPSPTQPAAWLTRGLIQTRQITRPHLSITVPPKAASIPEANGALAGKGAPPCSVYGAGPSRGGWGDLPEARQDSAF